MAINKGAFLILLFLFVSGCGTVERGTIPWEEESAAASPNLPASSAPETDTSTTSDVSNTIGDSQIQEFLQLAYRDWKGIPYLLGGSDYNGIDCSAFMQVVFEDYLMKIIPRTTLEQLQAGTGIKRNETKTGDLVFFKTGNRSYHVGVMINRNEFLHASTTEGVKISELNHPYWDETYLSTRRLF